jgi:hypothetical protein
VGRSTCVRCTAGTYAGSRWITSGNRHITGNPRLGVSARRLRAKWPVAVEKLRFQETRLKMGDRKCIANQRRSFIGHPSASQFRRKSYERVFQQLRLFTPVIRPKASWRHRSVSRSHNDVLENIAVSDSTPTRSNSRQYHAGSKYDVTVVVRVNAVNFPSDSRRYSVSLRQACGSVEKWR